MPFHLPPLQYPYDALEPYIDEQTMRLHHDKHHQTYVDKLNAAVEGTDLADATIEDVVRGLKREGDPSRDNLRNNGGGHCNHSLFWEAMSPDGGGEPDGELGAAIDAKFGSFGAFREAFDQAGVDRFGSGWAWLVLDGGALAVTSTANQDNPLTDGKLPLLGNDVWEHAYYLKYQNRRPEYLKAWWNVVSWAKVAERYAAARAAS
jgi:superoxide dismutase, Fe-Mn family